MQTYHHVAVDSGQESVKILGFLEYSSLTTQGRADSTMRVYQSDRTYTSNIHLCFSCAEHILVLALHVS